MFLGHCKRNYNSSAIEKLVAIEKKIDNLGDNLGTVLFMLHGLKDPKKIEKVDPEMKAQFPFSTMESLTIFNASVESDNDMRKKLVGYFSSVGGLSPKDFHTRSMSKIITNSLAMTCSWKGFKNNHKLGHLLILQCLYEAITEEYPLTMKEFEILTKDWLRHAKQRKERQESR